MTSNSQPRSPFTVKEHIVPCFPIREELTTTTSDQEQWRMSVKQYVPIDNPNPAEGDVTILGCHGDGFLRELYEPFWTDLYHALSESSIRIRSIWVLATSNSGSNTRLNEALINDPVSTLDHTHDILHLISSFPTQILQPIIGIGHSIGASQLAMASVFHPTLFAGLVLMDPILVPDAAKGSRKQAKGWADVAWKDWDERVRKMWMDFAIEPIDATDPEGATRLVWGRGQEMGSYAQLGYVFESVRIAEEEDARIGVGKGAGGISKTGKGNGKGMVFVTGPMKIWKFMPMMSTHTLILYGEQPGSALPDMKEIWKDRIGSDGQFLRRGIQRRVDIESVHGTGHLLPLEKPEVCAVRAAGWIREELEGWSQREGEPSKAWRGLGAQGREKAAEEWLAAIKGKL
ncbi:hypothetical protein VTL71DRAFT_5046 [Oculimacula yallundae]|uniref:AB hydrolase-1 domain-containing protein n=1 Tax=Oculimacula yallundae TaxID=86028 RepID=A0ABR4C1H7_9HELO